MVFGDDGDNDVTLSVDGTDITIDVDGRQVQRRMSTVPELQIRLGGGADTLDGGLVAKRLWIWGGAGNDVLLAGMGHDWLEGGAGDDKVDGGVGNDNYNFDADYPLGSDWISDPAGVDGLRFSQTTSSGVTLDVSSTLAQSPHSNLTLTLANGQSIETLVGTNKADSLTGNDGPNRLFGLGGDDTLIGGAGSDSYNFDADYPLGSDLVIDSGGLDSLRFVATQSLGVTVDLLTTTAQIVNDNLTLTLDSGNSLEMLHGGGQSDKLSGNELNNLLFGMAGDDTLNGGAGNDVYLFDADSPLGSDQIDESSGNDRLFFHQTTAAIEIDFRTPLPKQ